MKKKFMAFSAALLAAARLGAADFECVSGVYPHLAMFNDEGECGTGAVVPWAGDLWVVTYAPHAPTGSSDKLYRIHPDLTRETFSGSVGGTPANRLIHRETNQLLIGPYVIDAEGNVRVVPPAKMPGRLTGAARHLTDPANKVYVATMETGLYELDMRTLAVNTLIRENGMNDKAIAACLKKTGLPWPDGWASAPRTRVPGYHAKGLASGFGRVFISNNGENSAEARRNPFVPAGVLAWWDEPGKDWATIRRCQFTEVTTPDGIYGNEHPGTNPVWAMGWDAKSVILGVTTNGAEWAYYRLPKASRCYDGAHGWNTEWPRIRDVGFGDGTLLATMHGTFWRFPKGFSPANPNGIRPISTYLKVIGDFCRWGDRIVFGCDDQAKNEFLGKRGLKKGSPRVERSQSNLWFVRPDDLKSFGPPSGEGCVWLNEDVKSGDVSDPFLHAGYESMRFSFTRADGTPVKHELLRDGDWARVKCLENASRATARFRYGPAPCKTPALDAKMPYVSVKDDSGREWRFPNVNGDANVVCRELATERDLLYAGGVWYELPAENAGGFAALRPIALADAPVKSLRGEKGLMTVNGKAMALDDLWRNGTAPAAYWLWERFNGGRDEPVPRNVPELMRTFAGAEVKTAEEWEKVRAPELFECFEKNEYGRRPAAANERGRVSFDVYDVSEALGGKAVRKLVRVTYKGPNGTFSFPFTAYIPKTDRPVPAFVLAANIKRGILDGKQGLSSVFWPVEEIVARGYATAAFRFDFVAADRKGAGFSQGVFPAVQPESERDDESWGTLSAWAWGNSRILDWMETEPLIDAEHVGVVGHSRGGKTVILTAVLDRRFAMACSNNSGCSGAKLNHIDLPKSESIGQILKNFPYWFCKNYLKYAGKEMAMDFDQHEMLALIAPRLVCVASATDDYWAGPRGEWWAAKLASPAWELYGKKGLVADGLPAPEKPQQDGCISYHLRKGPHFLAPYDWNRYMDFADRHGWRAQRRSR